MLCVMSAVHVTEAVTDLPHGYVTTTQQAAAISTTQQAVTTDIYTAGWNASAATGGYFTSEVPETAGHRVAPGRIIIIIIMIINSLLRDVKN